MVFVGNGLDLKAEGVGNRLGNCGFLLNVLDADLEVARILLLLDRPRIFIYGQLQFFRALHWILRKDGFRFLLKSYQLLPLELFDKPWHVSAGFGIVVVSISVIYGRQRRLIKYSPAVAPQCGRVLVTLNAYRGKVDRAVDGEVAGHRCVERQIILGL